jgi:multicomponent Na+:H+ antiporter subunit B
MLVTITLQAVLFLALFIALVAVALRDVLNSIIAFAVFSFAVAITWVLFAAPDVALTEAAVGAGITTILFLVTIARTVRPSSEELFESIGWRGGVLAVALMGLLVVTVPSLPAIGSTSAPIATAELTNYYLENADTETGVKNVVTAILVAYRGFDTLGEATVVITAGLAALIVLRQEAFL